MMIGYYPNTHPFIYTQDKVKSSKRNQEGESKQEVNEHEIDKDKEYSQSVDFTPVNRQRTNSLESTTSSFLQSVQVVPGAAGKYEIYPGAHNPERSKALTLGKTWGVESLQESRNYLHNISNPDLWRTRVEESEWQSRKEGVLIAGQTRPVNKVDGMKKQNSEMSCNCGQYHSHTFRPPLCNEVSNKRDSLKRDSFKQDSLTESGSKKIQERNKNQMTIYQIFWCGELAFCDYKHGMKPVKFQSLWPKDPCAITDLIKCGVEEPGLRSAFWELCVLSILSGPLSVLTALLDLSFIRIDYQFENDPGLLHLACLLRNIEAVQLLIQKGVSVKMKDRSGLTAGQVCYCSKMKRQLPTKLQSTLERIERNKSFTALKPGLQDKDAIFRLASHPKSFYELQKKLQLFEFSVNTESNEKGDFLLHVACRSGICQLPLILSLVRLQNADVDLCNAEGMTPLMIASEGGDSVLCDILMCFFSANPNKCNERTGQTALHYAISRNHVNVVKSQVSVYRTIGPLVFSCLLKRGADVNLEDKNGYLPDDIPMLRQETDDCKEVIVVHRKQRNQQLAEMVTEDTVYPIDLRASDLINVDDDGYTLIMLAAKHDKVHNLETLLGVNTKTINAQHGHTGLTALGMAAKEGHHDACKVLLRFEANPSIADMQRYLPIHYAVLGNHEAVLDVFGEHFPLAYMGLFEALKLCRKSSIHDKLTQMWERRQEEIVNPELRLCAMAGNAERLFNVLETGDNVNCKSDLNSQPSLFIAVQNSHLEVVQLLKERGADLRKRDHQTGSTVLHIIAQTGHIEMAKYLLQFCKTSLSAGTQPGSSQRLDINAMNNEKKTPLQMAAERGYIKLTSLFIEHGATTAILNNKGALFTSPEYEGVRLQIETHRSAHTKQIMKLVAEKSKKALFMLEKVWLPRFDHNLRDQGGDTPLMVACRHSRLENVKLLLQSAVYANHMPGDEEEDNSDADSGVPDLPPWRSRKGSTNLSEELQASTEQSQDFGDTLGVMGVSYMDDKTKSTAIGAAQSTCMDDKAKSLNPGDKVNTLVAPQEPDARNQQLNTLLQDVERPKGLYIYHDGIVSHVCAVNLFDGSTPLHRAIEGGDNPVIVNHLVEADGAVINMQNDAGLTAVHLACKLGRKKVLESLLAKEGVDTSLRTLNGHLPEEMTTNKTLIRMVQKARRGQPVRPPTNPDIPERSASITESISSLPSSIGAPSTINFSKVFAKYKRITESQEAEKYKKLTENHEGERLDYHSLPVTSKNNHTTS